MYTEAHPGRQGEDLLAEQAEVQAGKHESRLLREYDCLIFPGQQIVQKNVSSVADFLEPLCYEGVFSTEALLLGIYEQGRDNSIHWADMCCGRALAMREMSQIIDFPCEMTGVDLFDWNLEGLKPHEYEILEKLCPGMTEVPAEPNLIFADTETVQLPRPAHLITAIEGLQYLNDPLKTICNWYNQLVDGGLIIISGQATFSEWIQYQEDIRSRGEREIPIIHILNKLRSHGIRFEVMDEIDIHGRRPQVMPYRIRHLVIQRLPGTSLRINGESPLVDTCELGYKNTYYPNPAENESLVEIDTH